MNRFPRKYRPFATLALVLAVTVLPVSVALADKDDHVEARELLRRGEILPLPEILDMAQRHVAGDIIEVELEREDSGWEYKVKVLTSTGRLKKVTLNARNGALIKIKDD
ncbi:PepSY domain-containing protein [Pseudoxanthomonas dokdonensis]|uniref:PepSY domain-containing protein n=1 Tax=Pseudoxanthomonas dokdonensis TaxID=344882 RepID=A0A0R0CWB4_9GAMM|nr:PepSY domain-containing protein [Pseudoxanthomonas dokdonensis]KRG70423.1 hypothetical protein ABB29_06640 [Pseudoxanthomonas dokdonensis]